MARFGYVCLLAVALETLLPSHLSAQSAQRSESWQFANLGTMPRWKDGLPVGNGRLGAQCWGDEKTLRLSLDRVDLWDCRQEPNRRDNYSYTTLREFVRTGQFDRIQTELNPNVDALAQKLPTHLLAGRMRIELPKGLKLHHAVLDMRQGEVLWRFDGGKEAPLIRIYAPRTAGLDCVVVEVTHAPSAPSARFKPLTEISPPFIEMLGYEPATISELAGADRGQLYRQPVPDKQDFHVAWASRQSGDIWRLVVAVPPQGNAPANLADQLSAVLDTAADGSLRKAHQRWWQDFWSRSDVDLPDVEMQRLYRNGLYKLASCSMGGSPSGLQGAWTPDLGGMPPWRGDYHLNMNVQETYWPAYSSNHPELAEPLETWLTETLAPPCRELTRRFFGVDGMWIGTAYDVKGQILGGTNNWMTVQYWLCGGPWIAQHLWWRYRYMGNEAFLRAKAYPFMKDCMTFFVNLLERGNDGKLHIPLSSSPEYFSNQPKAWTMDPTCDLSAVRNLARWCIEAAGVLDVDADLRATWQALDRDLAPYPVDETGLKVQPDTAFTSPHRHPIHLYPIFPGEDLTIEGSDADRRLVATSIKTWLDQGTNEWTGWSFPYASLILARAGMADDALKYLDIYRRAFIWPNGFHINGDYRKLGYSHYFYEPFTLEGECAFTHAVNEMLLQSWAGTIRVFPATPDAWPDAGFRDLRAEGAILVTAQRQAGRIVRLTLKPERSGKATVVWQPAPDEPVRKVEVTCEPGKEIVLVGNP